MKTTPLLALAALLASALAAASDPVDTAREAAPEQVGASVDSATRALRARYPARPAEFHADGSISQYIGATHLMQTVVRIGEDGKLEKICTTDDAATQRFMAEKNGDSKADAPGEEQ